MEFTFPVSEIFGSPIVEIGSNLLPPGFCGDRGTFWSTVTKVADVINAMGDASAAAQGLNKSVTTAERLRNSDQTIYLLVNRNAIGGKGVVSGMLRTGKKSLYIYDRDGRHYQVTSPCVLDFYVHDSQQRKGLGKQLFEHMLQKEQVEPVKVAMDRPSDKLLSFLSKHYELNEGLKQKNNYVVFDGFFSGLQDIDNNKEENNVKPSSNGLQDYTSYGRYGAPKPPSSMGEILQDQSIQSNDLTEHQMEAQMKTQT